MTRITHRAWLALLASTLSLLAACSGGGAATPTPGDVASSPSVTPTPTPTAVPYRPPHNRPGPAADTLRFRAFHTDIAAAAVTAGDIDLYQFSLKTEAARNLQDRQGIRLYQAPASSVALLLNPALAPAGELNPLSLQKVRLALQYAVNRRFIADEIYKGLAEPMTAHVGPLDADYETAFAVLKALNTGYDPELAKQLVTDAMRGSGAELKDGVWQFNGRPVRLKFIIRTEDERREIGDLFRAELEKLGFQVIPTYYQFAPAVLKVYGTDPQLFEWHIYTEGWGRGSAQRYDASNINQMCAPWPGNMVGWQETGFWQYEHPQLDALGKRLFQGDFRSRDERDQLYRDATQLCQQESVRLWIATVLNTFPATDTLAGITEDLVAGPKAIWSLREAHIPGKDTVTIGSLWVWTERTTWNPVGGFGDIYSTDIWRNIADPAIVRHPFTGDPIPFRATYQVETARPTGKLDVPADAVLWDAKADAFKTVSAGTKATSKVIFDFSLYFRGTWHHGKPITMADALYSIHQAFEIAYDDAKGKIEPSLAVTSRPYLDTFRGFRVLDDNRLEVYVDFWHFVPDYIAEYASVASLATPWEVLAAMDRLVFEDRVAAYSDTAATRFNVPWLSLVMPNDARRVRNAVRQSFNAGTFPQAALRIGSRELVTQAQARERYEATLAWFDRTNMLVISNGPYRLTKFDPAAQFAELEAVRDPTYPFKPGDLYKGSATGVAVTRVQADAITRGQDAAITVDVAGPSPLRLRYALVDSASGKVVASGDGSPLSERSFRVTLTATDTGAFSPGLYRLSLLAVSDALALPGERGVNVQVR